ncbi:SDR family NAD(P)-dependent oxidoreductase [Angustibacter sp. McL0619]|uniref:SDR family NAD(P)-dependent oxidoreductase n=1 Tax=Angustibacter sp. McL0619 TaxID=3415676 RepID=UPI003CF18572
MTTTTSPVAIVTGASQGLGLTLTAWLVRHGWHVVADARDATRLRAALAPFGRAVSAVPGDVTDAGHRHDLVAAAGAAGRLDLLVHNASSLGAQPLPPLADYPTEALTTVLDTNVVAPLALTRLALPLLSERTGSTRLGTVLAISSDAAVEAYEGWGGYGASKAALDHAMRVLAAERPDLAVYSVDPGDMRTQMHQDAFPGEDISDRPLPEEVVDHLAPLVSAQLPSGRYRAAELAVPPSHALTVAGARAEQP